MVRKLSSKISLFYHLSSLINWSIRIDGSEKRTFDWFQIILMLNIISLSVSKEL